MALRNAFENVSTEATLSELNDTVTQRSDSSGDAHLISATKLRYRREFNDPTFAAFNVVTGEGMTVASTNGNLVVTTGTTANSVTTITTKQTFSAPFKAAFGFKISQKIVNQEIYVEAVAVNEDGSLDENVVAAWRVAGSDSTTTTFARVETRNGGTSRFQSGNISTVSLIADAILEIVLESDEVQFHTRGIDSSAARAGSTTRNSVAPDPSRLYVLRYRIVNGSTAPASTTTFTSTFLTGIDYTEVQTEVVGGPGTTSAGQALPVAITSGAVTLANGTIGASTAVTGLLAAKVNSAATTNGTLIKSGATRIYGYQLANTTANWRYFKLYNLTTAPAVGTSAVVYVIPLAPNTTTDATLTIPISHATGASYAITAGSADTDTTAIGAGEVVGHLLYI